MASRPRRPAPQVADEIEHLQADLEGLAGEAGARASEVAALAHCLRALNGLDGTRVAYRRAPRGVGADGLLDLRGSWGEARYVVEVARSLTADAAALKAAQVASASKRTGRAPLLMCWYVNPAAAATLRGMGIDYVDGAGNMLLRQKGLYVWVAGRRTDAPPQRLPRAFQVTGLRLVTLLLEKPVAVTWTYRALAEASGVSLGAVGPALEDLRSAGYIHARRGVRSLVNRRALFERWELGYAETLRPRILRRTCRMVEGRTIEDLPGRVEAEGLRGDVLIGGELGAALLTQHLRPARAALYVRGGTVDRAVVRLRLLPDPAGVVDVLDAVNPHAEAHDSLASPLLIHAELLRGAQDGRLREAAELVYEGHLRALLEGPN